MKRLSTTGSQLTRIEWPVRFCPRLAGFDLPGDRPARPGQRPGDCRTFERLRLGWKMRWKIVSEPLRKTVSPSRLPAQGDKRPCHKTTGNLPFGHRFGLERPVRHFIEQPSACVPAFVRAACSPAQGGVSVIPKNSLSSPSTPAVRLSLLRGDLDCVNG